MTGRVLRTKRTYGSGSVSPTTNYFHKYSVNCTDMAHPLFNLLNKDVEWCWTSTKNNTFNYLGEPKMPWS